MINSLRKNIRAHTRTHEHAELLGEVLQDGPRLCHVGVSSRCEEEGGEVGKEEELGHMPHRILVMDTHGTCRTHTEHPLCLVRVAAIYQRGDFGVGVGLHKARTELISGHDVHEPRVVLSISHSGM